MTRAASAVAALLFSLALWAGCLDVNRIGVDLPDAAPTVDAPTCGELGLPCCVPFVESEATGCDGGGLACQQGFCLPPTQGCSTACSAATPSRFCVTGKIRDFINPNTLVPATAQSRARVRIYDPLVLLQNPQVQPLATADIQNQGCFIADGVARPSSNLVLMTVDDDDPATRDNFVTFATAAVLQVSQNVNVTAYTLSQVTASAWQNQLGASVPTCRSGTGLVTCGAWLGFYLDALGVPVSGVMPSRPGDDPPPGDVFCFRGDRQHLSTADTTDATGLCIITPDLFEPHGGSCMAGGCMCQSAACSPAWTASLGGSLPGLLFLATLTAQ
jgi:hypothetical protein